MKLTNEQEAWLQALESGAYRQVRSRLKTNEGFCCLGVACDVLKFKEWDHRDSLYHYENAYAHLPMSISTRLDMSSDGYIRYDLQIKFLEAMTKAGYKGLCHINLITYNDVGATFAQIAKAIRACPEAVFTNKE